MLSILGVECTHPIGHIKTQLQINRMKNLFHELALEKKGKKSLVFLQLFNSLQSLKQVIKQI